MFCLIAAFESHGARCCKAKKRKRQHAWLKVMTRPMICSLINAQQAAQRQEEIDALNQDEFDPEAQARIAERIQQENIQANMEAAFEHSPEAFSQVNMLYVRLEASISPSLRLAEGSRII